MHLLEQYADKLDFVLSLAIEFFVQISVRNTKASCSILVGKKTAVAGETMTI